MSDELPEPQRKILLHALGLTRHTKPYRDYFVTCETDPEYRHCCELEASGLMEREQEKHCSGNYVFKVTEAGKRIAQNKNS